MISLSNKYFIFQILPDGELKPQAKHLQTRVDYLLKVLKGKSAAPVNVSILYSTINYIAWFRSMYVKERNKHPYIMTHGFAAIDRFRFLFQDS